MVNGIRLQKSIARESISSMSPGTRIALKMLSDAALAETLLLCFRSSLVTIPIDPEMSVVQTEFVLSHSLAHFLFDGVSLKELRTVAPLSPSEDRFIVYTSGSTSEPKGVVLTRDAVEHNARAVALQHGFKNGSVHASCLPFYHCNAIFMSLIATCLHGADLLVVPKFEPISYFEAIDESGAQTASIVPALLEKLVAAKPEWPACLKYLITAAAPLSSRLAKKFFDLYGARLVQGYGMSEAVNFSAVMPLLNEEDFIANYIQRHPPVGVALPGTDLRLVNGEVQTRGPHLMRGYWCNASATLEAFTSDGWLKTGDLGIFRGEFLELRGRSKEVINRGGETIYPVDVQEEWGQLGGGSACVAVSVASAILSDDIGLITPHRLDLAFLKRLDKGRFAPAVVCEAPLKMTSTGKPKRKAMSAGLISFLEDAVMYDAVFRSAIELAESIESKIASGEKPLTAQSRFVARELKTLAGCRVRIPNKARAEGAAAELLSLIDDNWKCFASGLITGEEMMRSCPGLWERLMTEPPMGTYASAASDLLASKSLLDAKTLEFGAGVGNTSRLIRIGSNAVLTRTDKCPRLLEKHNYGGFSAGFDFDAPGEWTGLDTIFGVNALHCAKDIKASLSHLRTMLNPGGTLLIGEGQPMVRDGEPWVLNAAFGIFDGWWDRGGFVSREKWIQAIYAAGFERIGYSKIRAGSRDLGGLMWAQNSKK